MYKISTTEDQQKCAVPLNRDTEKIFYVDETGKNLQVILDGKVITKPRQWDISKVNRINPKGMIQITFYETEYNQNTAAIMDMDGNITHPEDFDKTKNVKAWYANYYSHNSILESNKKEEIDTNNVAKITYSGLKPQVIVGGNYKKFNVSLFADDIEVDYVDGIWNCYRYYIDSKGEKHIENDVVEFLDDNNSAQSIKLKIKNNTSYIGSILVVKYSSIDEKFKSSIECEIIGL